ncbi:MAG: hypothetical protein ACFE8J_15805, partial [Candidatus Heimdallarchaeota archaeon]
HNKSNFIEDDVTRKEEVFEDEIPKASEYQEFDGSGEQLNITLHQSLINSSDIEFTSLDDSNTFTEPVPNFNGYNTSYVNITIDAINAQNKTLNLELGTALNDVILSDRIVSSFRIRKSCILQNLSLYISESGGGTPDDATIRIQIFNSTWNSVESRIEPDSDTGLIDQTQIIPNEDTGQWYNYTFNVNLDASSTYDNTFFIYFRQTSDVFDTRAYYHYELDSSGEDNSDTYYSTDGGATWNEFSTDRDISSQIILGLNDNTPKPTDINLQINSTAITDDISGNNLGYWTPSQVFSSSTGEFNFSITADWWDVSCNVSNVHINYTKTDIRANSDFNIPASGQDVNWTVTIPGGLNYFDSRVDNFNTINFTIPASWEYNTINVFNDTDPFTDLLDTVLGNGYREVQVINAGNGTNWYLTVNSTNLISSIDTYVGGIPLIQVNFTNILRFNASFGAIVSNGDLNLSVYSPVPRYLNHSNTFPLVSPSDEIFVSDWDISDNVTDYGVFKAQMSWNNDTAAGFHELLFTVIANTDLKLSSPSSGQDHYDNELFDIIVFFNDTGPDLGDIGITSASITENSTLLGPPTPTGTDGEYSLQLDTDDFLYGWNYIEIGANKSFYHNKTVIFSFHHRINTSILPSDSYNFGDVIRGKTVSYNFSYIDILSNPIPGATIQQVYVPAGFVPNSFPIGGEPGNYTIELDTSNVQAQAGAYTCTFNITAIGNQTQEIDLILTVTQAQTSVIIDQLSYTPVLNRKDGFDQQVEFYFNDTDNDIGIPGITLGDIIVSDNQTGSSRSINSLTPFGAQGNYRLNISISGLNSGWIQFELNVSRDPDYNWSVDSFTFYLRGNITQTSIESITDIGGEGTLVPTNLNYSVYIGLNININFTILDSDYGNNLVTGDAQSYTVNYYLISNPTNQGVLANDLDFDLNTNSYKGSITTSSLTTLGTYAINITILKTNYEASNVIFNLTLKSKILVNISVLEKPAQVNAGDSFNLTLKAEFFNGTGWEPFNGVDVTITPNLNGINGTTTAPLITDINGTVTFTEITVGIGIRTLILYIVIEPAYNYTGFTKVISDIMVIVPPTTLEELLPYLIFAGVLIGAVVSSVAVYRGYIVPKKREKRRILSEVKTIFDDAINLEHILVLYKGTGTCIFFKSYGSEQIDPELIGGFLTAVSSFGKEMVAQEALNEISYGDKMLLLADGEFTRVALVLGKKGSLILRTHLKEFIEVFEKTYKDILPKWRGQLAYFKNAGQIVDEILNTSIILPHQISYDFANIKDLKGPHSRDVLKVAHSCCEEAGREFFFIATLLKEAAETSNKDTAEIFIGIKELRDKKILLPIEISAIEAQPISQQELNLLSQKVSSLTTLSGEEKQKLINDLAQMGPLEREAYLASISQQKEIVSAPIKSKVGTFVIENKKSAKNGIKELIKRAKAAKSKKNYDKTIEYLESAALIASNWKLSNEFIELEEVIRKIKIENLLAQKKELENKAKFAVKKKIYIEAAEKYKAASKIASEIFKLGATEMTKEVKRLTNKANEFEKLK